MSENFVHIKSGWKDPIGVPLTNRLITKYEKLGFYGHEREVASTNGVIHRCVECNTKKRVIYQKFRYLPKPGYYCPSCVAQHRAVRDEEENQKQKWRELTKAEYV